MKNALSNITLIVLVSGLISSCNVMKRGAKNEYLLKENEVLVKDKKDNSETINMKQDWKFVIP